jgi:hypothetical protein
MFYYRNNITTNILTPPIIKQSNSTHAIIMLGLFASWLVEICQNSEDNGGG